MADLKLRPLKPVAETWEDWNDLLSEVARCRITGFVASSALAGFDNSWDIARCDLPVIHRDTLPDRDMTVRESDIPQRINYPYTHIGFSATYLVRPTADKITATVTRQHIGTNSGIQERFVAGFGQAIILGHNIGLVRSDLVMDSNHGDISVVSSSKLHVPDGTHVHAFETVDVHRS